MTENEARDSLVYIQRVMRDVRRRNIIDGVYYMIWGIVIPLCTILTQWLVISDNGRAIGIVWIVGMFLGGIACFLTGWFRGRQKSPQSGDSRLYYTAWFFFAITAVVIMVVSWGFGKFSIPQFLFIFGLLLTIVYALDASFSGLKWLYAVAFGWLVVGIVGLWLPMVQASLLFGLATIPLELVPGIVLTRIYQREQRGTA